MRTDARGCRQEPHLTVVPKPVELDLGDLRAEFGQIIAQLAERLEAMVAEELRGVVGAAEETAAIAALLGHQQRLAGVLPVHRSEAREAPDERLRAADRCLDFAEVDASYAARGNHVARHWEAGAVEDAVLGAA